MRLRVKEFADFSNISVRALHLYDRINLFHPNNTDESNGYRYYDADQLLELNTILGFKRVGFTLNEIKALKENGFSRDEIVNKLKDKMEENRRQIEISAYNLENLQQMLDGLDTARETTDDTQEAMRLSRLMCLENDKLENELSQILWL